MTILIPAYEPDEKLLQLIKDIKARCQYSIVVVDDGSGDGYNDIFTEASELGCKIIRYMPNKGKGHALKTGFQYILDEGSTEGVVCADSDGQHTAEDILKVASQINPDDSNIVIGSRRFAGRVPFKSLFGNKLTAINFFLSTGIKLNDTQTGLRGFNAKMLPWLCEIKGNRYEYELNMLLEAKKAGYGIYEVAINTIYIEDNKSSHFRPLIDSLRIYGQLIKFSLSSILSAVLDFIILIVMEYFTENLLVSVVAARVVSSVFNFTVNNKYVFNKGENQRIIHSAAKYFSLVLIILASNYCLLYLFRNIFKMYLVIAKILTELILFAASYKIQQLIVFPQKFGLGSQKNHSGNTFGL